MNKEIAKDIFIKYGGNFFHMERDGEYENYKKFSITKEQESEWLDEYQNYLLTAIKNEKYVGKNFINLAESLRVTCCVKNIESFLKIIIENNYSDTFSMIRVSEEVMDIADKIQSNFDTGNTKIKDSFTKFFTEFWKDKENDKITIDSYYSGISYLRDILIEDKIYVRRSKILERIKRDNYCVGA